MKGSGAVRALRAAGVLVALAFLALSLRAAARELAAGGPVHVDAARAGAALALLVATFLGMIALWRMLLADVGAPLGYRQAVQLWSFSNLGRYIPGKVWQMLGLVAFARDLGVAPGRAVASAVLALWLMIGTGAAVGLVLLPGSVLQRPEAAAAAALAAATLLGPALRPDWIHRGLRRLPRALGCGEIAPVGRARVLRWIALFALAWAAHGAVFSLFASAFGALGWADVRALTGAWSLAYVVGLAAVVVPGGIGVREGVLGFLLGPVVGADVPVHVVAVASRVWAIAGELVVLGLAAALRARGGAPGR
jgi:hypothetical protein